LSGVTGLRVEGGRLTETVPGDPALLHVERRGPPPGEDQLHSVAVRLRMGRGETVGAGFFSGGRLSARLGLHPGPRLDPVDQAAGEEDLELAGRKGVASGDATAAGSFDDLHPYAGAELAPRLLDL
jgi:hypothetical protein